MDADLQLSSQKRGEIKEALETLIGIESVFDDIDTQDEKLCLSLEAHDIAGRLEQLGLRINERQYKSVFYWKSVLENTD